VATSMRARGKTASALAVAAMILAGAGCQDEKVAAGGDKPVAKQAAAKEKPAAAKPKARPKEQPAVLAAGTSIAVVLQHAVDTGKAQVGQRVTLHTAGPVQVTGDVVVPAGALVQGTVTHVKSAGRMKGGAELTLRFTELQLPGGKSYAIECEPYRVVSKGDGKETAAEIGGGAAAGGLLAGVVGGKDDILKGAAIGAAVGTGVAVATKGQQIVLPAGKSLEVRLVTPLDLGTRTAS